MIIWMQHPQHGKHPATGIELADMEKNGWTRCPPKQTNNEPLDSGFFTPENSADVDAAKKRGRPRKAA
jgi:hypothetical protein